jgi:hypothetical protein
MWLPIINTVGNPTHTCLNGQVTHLKPLLDQLIHPI